MDIKEYERPIIMIDDWSGNLFLVDPLKIKKLTEAHASLEQTYKRWLLKQHLKEPFLERLYSMKGLVV